MRRGAQKGEARRKGVPNKDRAAFAAIIEKVISTQRRVQLLAELAEGITVQEDRKDGPVIYTRPPDALAIKQLNEYQYGKPAQQVEVSTPDGQPFPIAIIPNAGG